MGCGEVDSGEYLQNTLHCWAAAKRHQVISDVCCFVQSLYFSLYLSSLFRWAVYWQIVTAHLLLSTLCCWLYSLCRCHRRLICANVQINSLWWIFKVLSKLALRKANLEKENETTSIHFQVVFQFALLLSSHNCNIFVDDKGIGGGGNGSKIKSVGYNHISSSCWMVVVSTELDKKKFMINHVLILVKIAFYGSCDNLIFSNIILKLRK